MPGFLAVQGCLNILCQGGEPLEDLALAGNQTDARLVGERQASPAVVLHFKQVIGVIERLGDEDQREGEVRLNHATSVYPDWPPPPPRPFVKGRFYGN